MDCNNDESPTDIVQFALAVDDFMTLKTMAIQSDAIHRELINSTTPTLVSAAKVSSRLLECCFVHLAHNLASIHSACPFTYLGIYLHTQFQDNICKTFYLLVLTEIT